jgi:hypothetical protein
MEGLRGLRDDLLFHLCTLITPLVVMTVQHSIKTSPQFDGIARLY